MHDAKRHETICLIYRCPDTKFSVPDTSEPFSLFIHNIFASVLLTVPTSTEAHMGSDYTHFVNINLRLKKLVCFSKSCVNSETETGP